ncbi:ankyrin repeat domain-containing protein [Sphingobium aquiterrae]|uniref:ankyrin repeat domain-containing protein n=1 Tax=Sphingobium aquiterrae TaxID=2038656 RepID=UPI0030175626
MPLAGVAMAPQAAHAQFSDGYNFLKAVRDADGTKAMELIQKPGGATLINARDIKTGETALHVVVARRDITWLSFMLGKGAKPDIANDAGDTPLMSAVQLRFEEGARLLMASGATVDKPNDNGETPLIRAVQLRDIAMVRLLVAQGANADKRDSIAGMSARDYAQRDARTPGLVEALSTAKAATATKAPVQGPTF